MSTTLLADVEGYLSRYVTFTDPAHAFAASLWAASTYLYPSFDAFPYLVITSDTKRSGKSRFSEVLQNVSFNPRSFTGMTVAALYQSMNQGDLTMFIDEAETLSSEAASTMRAILNSGYRKGTTIPRGSLGGEITEYSVYCPKVFVLIGDVYDTLRDRSIVIRMQRGTPPHRFSFETARVDGKVLSGRLRNIVADSRKTEILDAYASGPDLDFLDDRDEEIWRPLFALCTVLAPGRIAELQRAAVDMATEKTLGVRKYTTLGGAEKSTQADDYAKRLVRDLLTVMGDNGSIWTQDALDGLRELPTGPWRKFQGTGLTPHSMSNLLSTFGIKPKLIRVGGRKTGRVARGYERDVIEAAVYSL